MGSSSSKGRISVGQAARAAANGLSQGKTPGSGMPPTLGGGDPVTKFKPTKVVEMSRPEAQAAAKAMYEQRVPEMNPDVLQQALKLGPAEKTEFTRQKLVPDNSELEVSTAPRPLPRDRSRVAPVASEVEETKGFLTQTQLAEVLKRLAPLSGTSSQELTKSVAGDFYISEESVTLLERYYRAPDVRMSGGVMTARWQWPGVK